MIVWLIFVVRVQAPTTTCTFVETDAHYVIRMLLLVCNILLRSTSMAAESLEQIQ